MALTARPPALVLASELRLWLLQFLLVFYAGSGNVIPESSSSVLVVNGILGESVTLPLKLPTDRKISTIIWSYSDVAFIILNLGEQKGPQYTIIDERWTERLNFTESFSMCLSNLTAADTGLYKVQIDRQIVSTYTLRIFRRLRNLKVTKHVQLSANGTCEIQLACSVEDPDDTVSFRWQASEDLSLNESNLVISWDPRNSSEQDYTCIAENPVSNLSSSVSAQSLCKDILAQEDPSQHRMGLILGAAVAALMVAGILLYRLPRTRRRQGSFPLFAQQTQNPVASSQDVESPSVSPGSTVYAQVTHPLQKMEIPTPTKNDSVTIYSTVNQFKERKPISPKPTTLNNNK